MPSVSPKKKPGKVAETVVPTGGQNLVFKVLLVLLAGLFVYAPIFHADWLWDDDQEITANQILPDDGGLVKIWTGLTTTGTIFPTGGADYFPLKTSFQWVLYRFFGTDRTGWHLTNVILHLLNCLLVWRVLSRLGLRQAWLGGLLFAIHPVLVESVAWVSELKNTLSLPFLLGSFLAFLNYDERKESSWLISASLLYLAAILCKTSVVMFPFVILLYCWWKRGKITLDEILVSIPFFFISAVFGAITAYFQSSRAIGTEIIPVGGMLSRTATAGISIWFYLLKSILPFDLLPIYPRWKVDPPSPVLFLAWPILFGLLIWFWTKRQTWGRHVLFGLGFFLINLLPIIGFMKMSYMRITWAADHFIYLPIIGLIGLAVGSIGWLYDQSQEDRRRYLLAGGLAIFAVLLVDAHRYAGIFYDEYALWTYTLQRNPNAWQAHSRLGKVLIEKNQPDAAFYHISESVRLRPDLAETHNNYGAMLEKKGDIDGALQQLHDAVRIAPDIMIYQVNLGSLLVRTGRYAEGLEAYEDLLKKEPENPTFLCNYGVALYFLNRNDEAIDAFQKALKGNPDLKDARENLQAALKKRAAGSGFPAQTPAPIAPEQFPGLLNTPGPVKLFGN